MSLINSLNSGVSALKSFTKGIEVIGNNIANVNTTAFKASRVNYSESFSDILRRSNASPSDGTGSNLTSVQVGTGVQIGDISSRFSQGSINTTGITSDLAIAGEGFFQVRDPAGGREYATRSGIFRVDDRGNFVTPHGLRVQGLGGGSISYQATSQDGELIFTPIGTAPAQVGDIDLSFNLAVGSGISNATAGSFSDTAVEARAPSLDATEIDEFGNIRFLLSNGDSYSPGRVLLFNFRDPQALVREGNGLYSAFDSAGVIGGGTLSASDNAPGSKGLGTIQAGALELSNVDLTEEFANVISTQRSFQAGARILTVSDDILQEVVNLKR